MWWEILDPIIASIAGALAAIFLVEKKKTADKRKVLLKVLRNELSKYEHSVLGEKPQYGRIGWGMPYRPNTLWYIITSDILDPRKDWELMYEIYEMIGWVENHNIMNNLANISLVFQAHSEATKELSHARDSLAYNSCETITRLIKLIDRELTR